MRIFPLLLVAGLIVTATAGPSPLSNKEIALMLRSGYSSDAVLAEITSRRVLEAFDPAMQKSLVDFGANPQLISALASNAYVVSAAEADRAKQREAELSAQRAAEIERSQKLSTIYRAGQAEARARTAAAPSAGTPMLDALRQKLVRCHDGTVSRAIGTELDNKKFVALYYSAHWCAPCRKFTPQLVDYYNRVVVEHPEFELVFVSADRSRFGWETYIQEAKMPWLAIDYDQLADLPGLKQLGGNGIPSLLVLDASSHIVASSYDGDKYLGPQNALAALDKIFATNAGPIAEAR